MSVMVGASTQSLNISAQSWLSDQPYAMSIGVLTNNRWFEKVFCQPLAQQFLLKGLTGQT